MKSLRILWLVGTLLAIVGSFLPWEKQGDFFPYWTYGIRLFPKVSDYGGVSVVLLTMSIALLTLKLFRFIRNPRLWNFVLSALLMAASLLFVTRWLVHRFESAGSFGAASLEIGLVGVLIGSALLFWVAVVNYRQVFNHPTKSMANNIST